MLARDMVAIFSLILHIWKAFFHAHSHNQKDRGEATFLKTLVGWFLLPAQVHSAAGCPGHTEATSSMAVLAI